jgi:hypothetical protein
MKAACDRGQTLPSLLDGFLAWAAQVKRLTVENDSSLKQTASSSRAIPPGAVVLAGLGHLR